MLLSVGEAAQACGVSVRTLHHYDRLNLVKPSAVSPAGYRSYDGQALARLQTVLFYKELGFSLGDIASMLDKAGFETRLSLENHRALLLMKRGRLDEMITMVDAALGGKEMKKVTTTAADIRAAKQRYAAEAKARWGDSDAYKATSARVRSPEEERRLASQMDDIFSAFADCAAGRPDDPQVQALVRRWQDYISAQHYPCSNEILAGLGEMYIADERFTASLDRYGEGTARLMSEAIKYYCSRE